MFTSTVGCASSRICVRLGNGHQPAAWHRRGGWRVDPGKDYRQAVGEPHCTDGVQWRAAHSPFGQRQAGKLMSPSDRELWGIVWSVSDGQYSTMPKYREPAKSIRDYLCWAEGEQEADGEQGRGGSTHFWRTPLLLRWLGDRMLAVFSRSRQMRGYFFNICFSDSLRIVFNESLVRL